MQTKQSRVRAIKIAATVAVTSIIVGEQKSQASAYIYDGFDLSPSTANAVGGSTADTGQTWYPGGTPDNEITALGLAYPTATQAGNSSYNSPPAVEGGAVTLLSTDINADHIGLTPLDSSTSTFNSGEGISTNDYYSLLLNVSSTAGLQANGTGYSNNSGAPTSTYNYGLVASFSDGNGLTGGNPGTQITGIYLQQGTVAGTYQVGIGGNRNGVVWDPTNITAGTPVFVVGEWVSQGGGSFLSQMWEDPTLGQSTAPTTTYQTTSGDNGGDTADGEINSFVLSSEAGLPTAGVQVDEVRVDQAWANVTPEGAVPEPASLSILMLGGVGMLSRRRRAANH